MIYKTNKYLISDSMFVMHQLFSELFDLMNYSLGLKVEMFGCGKFKETKGSNNLNSKKEKICPKL